ncbi:MAG: DUF2214 family protein [Gemmatimonadaceae bacterium]|nr:DUF2214 family protein [Gemmatimonadaceae bacterium]
MRDAAAVRPASGIPQRPGALLVLRLSLAIVHLLALGIGLGAVFARSRHLAALPTQPGALTRAFAADNWWGLAALLWVGSGLWRAFAGTEKASAYYWAQPVFWIKMGLLGAIVLLELWPMVTLVRWRIAQSRGTLPALEALRAPARTIAVISAVQVALTVALVVPATMLARGYGAR